MNVNDMILKIENGGLDRRLTELYGDNELVGQRERYVLACRSFSELFGDNREVCILSVPGRSEISGNHTDHNCGRVIASAVDLDIIAVASPASDSRIRVKSRGFDADEVSSEPDAPRKDKYFTSAALISGTVAAFVKNGYSVGGFDCYTDSSVPVGSGLSSSAAYEVMLGTVLNHLYNGGKIDPMSIALMSKYAENEYFGKPCGLMDQAACSIGGFCFMDFEDPSSPVCRKLDFELDSVGYCLCITNTGGNHSDLNNDFSGITREMSSLAAFFGKKVLRGVELEELISNAGEIRAKLGDRAFLRGYHFITENERVYDACSAIEKGDITELLGLISASGESSFKWLQNAYSPSSEKEQGIPLALAVSEHYLARLGCKGAVRVHGGGFAGTVQAFVPRNASTEYKNMLENVFGAGSVRLLRTRKEGAIRVI